MKKYLLIVVALMSFSATTHAEEVLDCENQYTTSDINQCAMTELQALEAEQAEYLAMSLKHHADNAELVSSIKTAQKDWEIYKSSHCSAVYTQWRDGTIRGLMSLSCKQRLTQQRTHNIWLSFLTYMDSTPPLLPEPARD